MRMKVGLGCCHNIGYLGKRVPNSSFVQLIRKYVTSDIRTMKFGGVLSNVVTLMVTH
jgi:hypothetical protein